MINKNKKIAVCCFDTTQTPNKIFLEYDFYCDKCKHLMNCADLKDCYFVRYIQNHLQNTVYQYETNIPTLKVLCKLSDFEYMHINRTIARSERLRLKKQR